MGACQKNAHFPQPTATPTVLGVLADTELREGFRKEQWEEQGHQGWGVLRLNALC